MKKKLLQVITEILIASVIISTINVLFCKLILHMDTPIYYINIIIGLALGWTYDTWSAYLPWNKKYEGEKL